VLALVGYYVALREIRMLMADAAWVARAIAAMHLPDADGFATLIAWRDGLWVFLALLVGATLLARVGRELVERRGGLVRVRYPGGQIVTFAPGMTVLEASRSAGVPHASVCGGRGRCSTCRVRCGAGVERLLPPSDHELRVLRRV